MQHLRERWNAWSTGQRTAVLAGIAVFVLVVAIAVSGGDSEPRDIRGDSDTPVAAETGAQDSADVTDEQASAAADEPTPTAADARAAVDEGDYATARDITDQLSAATSRSIERRIANRAARTAERALARGDRRAASRALRNAGDVPSTTAFAAAKADLQAAQARAAARRAAERRARAARKAAAREARRVAREQARAAREAEAAAEAAAEESDANSGCHPSYEGACLDPSSPDYDCAGGSGNGPDYTGPVTVVGPDEYDLDRDGDGVGCQS